MTEHKQLPSNLLVIDSEWLGKIMQKLVDEHNSTDDEDDKSLCITKYTMLKYVKNNSYQLTPILEDAMENATNSVKYHTYSKEVDYDEVYRDMQSYLSQPITLKK
jgi:hypothetical protein